MDKRCQCSAEVNIANPSGMSSETTVNGYFSFSKKEKVMSRCHSSLWCTFHGVIAAGIVLAASISPAAADFVTSQVSRSILAQAEMNGNQQVWGPISSSSSGLFSPVEAFVTSSPFEGVSASSNAAQDSEVPASSNVSHDISGTGTAGFYTFANSDNVANVVFGGSQNDNMPESSMTVFFDVTTLSSFSTSGNLSSVPALPDGGIATAMAALIDNTRNVDVFNEVNSTMTGANDRHNSTRSRNRTLALHQLPVERQRPFSLVACA